MISTPADDLKRSWQVVANEIRGHVRGCGTCRPGVRCLEYARLNTAERRAWNAWHGAEEERRDGAQ